MKNFEYIVFFLLFSLTVSGQTKVLDTLSDTEIKVPTKYGSLIVNKGTRGQNSYLSVHSSFYGDYECPLLDYTVWGKLLYRI